MKKKHVIPALIFTVTTSFSVLTFSACNTTDQSNINNNNSNPPAIQEEPEQQQAPANDTNDYNRDTANIMDDKNYDGIKYKKGILLDDTDTSKK